MKEIRWQICTVHAWNDKNSDKLLCPKYNNSIFNIMLKKAWIQTKRHTTHHIPLATEMFDEVILCAKYLFLKLTFLHSWSSRCGLGRGANHQAKTIMVNIINFSHDFISVCTCKRLYKKTIENNWLLFYDASSTTISSQTKDVTFYMSIYPLHIR